MSKRFKGKTCVYCGVATAETGDHVFARQLFLEARRANLPKVPACKGCNGEKADLEHYLAAVLPFGGRHPDGAENLETMVPKRLAKNVALHASLQRGIRRVWTQERGMIVRTSSIPFDWDRFERWIVFIVKGLAWHHWQVLLSADCHVEILGLTRHGERFFEQFERMGAAQHIPNCPVGDGTFAYEARQGTDNPQVSIWKFSIYGGMVLAGDPTAPGHTVKTIGAMVGPKRVFERAARTSKWLRGHGAIST